MNWDQLRKLIGKPLRLRSQLLRIAQTGQRLHPRDDQWTLEKADRREVLLKNQSTGHNLTLGSDNVREFRTPDFLLLRCQVIVRGPRVLIEPLIIRQPEKKEGST